MLPYFLFVRLAYADSSFSNGHRPWFAGLVEGSCVASIPVTGAHNFVYSLYAVVPVQKIRVMCVSRSNEVKSFGIGLRMVLSPAPVMSQLCRTSHSAR